MTESHLRLTSKESDILGLKRKLDLAKGIIEKGGRPSIVRAVCQITKASALQLHKEIHGHGPNAGLLPYDPGWIAKSPRETACTRPFISTFFRNFPIIPQREKGLSSGSLYALRTDINGQTKGTEHQ